MGALDVFALSSGHRNNASGLLFAVSRCVASTNLWYFNAFILGAQGWLPIELFWTCLGTGGDVIDLQK